MQHSHKLDSIAATIRHNPIYLFRKNHIFVRDGERGKPSTLKLFPASKDLSLPDTVLSILRVNQT
jgi:hypothetical protein